MSTESPDPVARLKEAVAALRRAQQDTREAVATAAARHGQQQQAQAAATAAGKKGK